MSALQSVGQEGLSCRPQMAFLFLLGLEQNLKLLAVNPEVGKNREFRRPKSQGLCSWPISGLKKLLTFFRPTIRDSRPIGERGLPGRS